MSTKGGHHGSGTERNFLDLLIKSVTKSETASTFLCGGIHRSFPVLRFTSLQSKPLPLSPAARLDHSLDKCPHLKDKSSWNVLNKPKYHKNAVEMTLLLSN